MNVINKWKEFYNTKLQPDARKLTYELNTLCRYISRNSPLSEDSIDALAPQLAELKSSLEKINTRLVQIERGDL